MNDKRHNPFYFLDGLPDIDGEPNVWTPLIFDAPSTEDKVPPGFNAVLIKIDGRVDSDLNWKLARQAAQSYIAEGFKIFWEIDLGLFSKLKLPLTDQSQYLSLGLSLDHFRDSIWKEFQQHSVGLSIYRGSVDFGNNYLWDEEQNRNLQGWLQDHFHDITSCIKHASIKAASFNEINNSLLATTVEGKRLQSLFCRDAALEYINTLTRNLPDLLSTFVLLDTASIKEPLLLSQLLSKDLFGRQQRVVSEGIVPLRSFIGTHSTGYISLKLIPIESQIPPTIGVCLSSSIYSDGFQEVLNRLLKQNVSFRFIPESLLTTEWDGLDFLLVQPESLGPQGMRKLRGFCAAGGTVVLCDCEDTTIGLAQEIPFPEWIASIHYR